MICCFYNLHEQENAKNLVEHFDKEIENAIGRGCTVFFCGKKYPEDEIFAQRVKENAKHYAEGVVMLAKISEDSDEALKKLFIKLADWEIYSYELV